MEVEADFFLFVGKLFIFSPKVATSDILIGQAQIERYRPCVLCSVVRSIPYEENSLLGTNFEQNNGPIRG